MFPPLQPPPQPFPLPTFSLLSSLSTYLFLVLGFVPTKTQPHEIKFYNKNTLHHQHKTITTSLSSLSISSFSLVFCFLLNVIFCVSPQARPNTPLSLWLHSLISFPAALHCITSATRLLVLRSTPK